MRFTRKLTVLMIISLFAFTGCKKSDSAASNPAYIEVESFSLTTISAEGTASHEITDAWIYVNDQLMGVFDLPARVPTLLLGNQEVKIFAGIKKNGQNNDRVRYDFYTNYEASHLLEADSTYVINPAITYTSGLTIWEEGFEDGGIAFSKTATSDTNFVQDNTAPFEGSKSGTITFDPADLFFEARTNEPSFDNFPGVGQAIYLELNYKSNIDFTLGLLNNDGSLPADAQVDLFTFTPSDDWNKTYISLSDAVSSLSAAITFDLYFKAVNNGSVAVPKIEMDNIKVVF